MADPRVPAAASEGMGKGPLSLQLVHQASQYPHTDIIVLASGTGVDTMRAFLTSWGPYIGSFKGLVWLCMVVDTRDIVVAGDWQKIQEEHDDLPDEHFRFTAALYNEMDACVGAPFLEDMLDSWRYEIFDRRQDGAHIYVIGHEGLIAGIGCALEGWPTRTGSTTRSSCPS